VCRVISAFGFATFCFFDQRSKAIAALHNLELEEVKLQVSDAADKKKGTHISLRQYINKPICYTQ
jgi:hypothetical protein